MAKSNADRSAVQPRLSMSRSAVADIVGVLVRHNPHAARAVVEATGRAAAAFGAAAATLTEKQQRQLGTNRKGLAQIIAAVVDDLADKRPSPAARLFSVLPKKAAEESIGAGVGKLVGRGEGLRRIADYAVPKRLEDWAGPVAGPGQLQRDYGIKRSTLHAWHKRGAIVGLLKGERKHVFPLQQFIDGRPVEGMAQITKVIDNPRAAWLWLMHAHPTGDHTSPLERLKRGQVDEVKASAERDFG